MWNCGRYECVLWGLDFVEITGNTWVIWAQSTIHCWEEDSLDPLMLCYVIYQFGVRWCQWWSLAPDWQTKRRELCKYCWADKWSFPEETEQICFYNECVASNDAMTRSGPKKSGWVQMKQITSQRMRTQDNWMIFVLVKTRMLKMKTLALGLMEGIKKLIPTLALVFYSLKKCG